MKLVAIACEDFRNLHGVELAPHPRFNILEGRNGQGKTNLLEAIHLLGLLRSFRDAQLQTMIAFDAPRATIRATLEREGVERTIGIELSPKGKRVVLDGRVVTEAAAVVGQLSVVLFGPEDLELTKGGPTVRRRFLDRAVFGVWAAYYDEARAYVTALRNRNRLLKDAASGPADPTMLDVFDVELARRGARVLWRRLSFVCELRPLLEEVFGAISGGRLAADVAYDGGRACPAGGDEDELEVFLLTRLRATRESDLRRGYTGAGPHSDDLAVTIDGRSARLFASQGQHRALALALKIAEMQRIEEALGASPVLLLDDVSSELDRERNAHLMHYLDRGGGQVFITTTDRSWIRVTGESQVFRVADGSIGEVGEVSQLGDEGDEIDRAG